MTVEDDLGANATTRDSWLSIGVFDGVHLGHRHLINHLLERAANSRAISGVITFQQHPRQVISPQTPITYLTAVAERLRLLQGLGVEMVLALPFTLELAQLSARDFLTLLQRYLKMRGLVVGPNFALGRGREGNIATLRRLALEMSFQLLVVPHLTQGEHVVSSTGIRKALTAGDMAAVTRMLGRPFSLAGVVVSGNEVGRRLGFPTANLDVNSNSALPADGVYITRAYLADKCYPSVTNIGRRPTFGGGERTIEVFLLDFSGDLYHQNLRIELMERLRAEKRFANPQELQAQIAQDVQQARARLAEQRI